jgi:hypothetical protein
MEMPRSMKTKWVHGACTSSIQLLKKALGVFKEMYNSAIGILVET